MTLRSDLNKTTTKNEHFEVNTESFEDLGNICIATCNDDLVHCCNLSVGYSCFLIIANVGLLSKKSSIISSVFPLVSLLKGNEEPLRT